MSRAIVSVAVRHPYVTYGERLRVSLDQFGCADYVKIFDDWPPGGPNHFEHHYAFKVFAVKHARDLGHEQVIWVDSQCWAEASLEPLWQQIERDGFYFMSGREPLGEWISDQALARFGVTREEAMTDHFLFGGAPVGLDFRNDRARSFYDEWIELASTPGGLFMSSHSEHAPDQMRSLMYSDGPGRECISTDPRVKGHRSDEACFSLMAWKRGMKQTIYGGCGECFKHDGQLVMRTC